MPGSSSPSYSSGSSETLSAAMALEPGMCSSSSSGTGSKDGEAGRDRESLDDSAWEVLDEVDDERPVDFRTSFLNLTSGAQGST